MKSTSRRALIQEAVAVGTISVEALAVRFGVSQSTIRRDLARMSSDGLLLRTYGGATGIVPELGISEREHLHRSEKNAIAHAGATRVRKDQSIYIDSGSTCGALAAALTGRHGLSVVTSGLSIAERLMAAEGVETVLLGGTIRRLSRGTTGSHAVAAMRRLQVETAFLGADGVDPKRGLCEGSFEQSALKEAVISHASSIVVLADATKLDAPSSCRAWTPLDVPWTLITDWRATQQQLRAFYSLNHCDVVVAEPRTDNTHHEPPVPNGDPHHSEH